jgi:hypothetical protein
MMNVTHKITTKTQQSVSSTSARIHTHLRTLSSKINLKKTLSEDAPPNPQPFVKIRLKPGESDPMTKISGAKPNPIYRPRWKNKAQIISAEDFAARPKVSFEEQFDSMHDAMVVLSWLDESKRQDVYQMYLELMVEQEKEFKTTSHEYVMRVIAEKFNLTPIRVAAIVQNCHDEEQTAKKGGYVNEKMAKYVDAKIKEHIDNAYMAYGEVNPNEYVESPVGAADISGESSGDFVRVEDLYDVDELTKEAILREKGEAQLLIDQKVYIEDVDNGKVTSKANAECVKLIEKADQDFKDIKNALSRTTQTTDNNNVEFSLPDNGAIEDEDGNTTETTRRQRWKYVGQMINVRQQKKTGKKSRRGAKLKFKDQKANTLVEEDGVLKLATVEEVAQTSWKRVRNEDEFTYKGVKDAWLNRQLKGEKYGWGRVPDSVKVKPVEEEVAEKDGAIDEEVENVEEMAKDDDGDDKK